MKTQRENLKQCDLLAEHGNRWQVSADRMAYDAESIKRTLKLFREYYQLNLTKEQDKELTKLRDFVEYLAFSYYWSAAESYKKCEDLFNKHKPFVFG